MPDRVPVSITEANRVAFERLTAAEPVLVDLLPAGEALRLPAHTVLHAGPAIEWARMCDPLQGAVLGAIRYEGWAGSEAGAHDLVGVGKIRFAPCHDHQAVGPMTGIITASMPVFLVRNAASGNLAVCTINEGIGKVLRFGANDEEVLERLRWLAQTLAPALRGAIRQAGGIPLRPLVAQALIMGDELHQRNAAASCLLLRALAPHLACLGLPSLTLGPVLEFLASNDQFFLNVAMAAAKAALDPVMGVEASTVVTVMCRNGTDFGIQIAGLRGEWFTAPVNTPVGLFFPGFSQADANPDMGDSAILETLGLGAFAMATSPAVARFVGAGSPADAIRISQEMGEITIGRHPHFPLPNLNFEGTPAGVDVRKVVETGITPLINTGIAHRKAGVGQVGAGTVRAPLACFTQALAGFATRYPR